MVYNYCPGARDLLEKIQQANLKAALVTSSNDVKMARLWQQIPELKTFFTVVIDGNMVSRSKPDPEGYLTGAKAIGSIPESCVVFEDSLQGVKAGKAAGSYVVGVAGTLPETVISPYCDIVVNSLTQIDFNLLCGMMEKRIQI